MSDGYGIALFPQHQTLLRESAIDPDVARARGYRSVDTKAHLESIDIPKTHRLIPGLLIPVYGPEAVNGCASTWQYRPDHPNVNAKGKPVKYVTAMRGMVVDVPPAVKPVLGDPEVPLWITEGSRKADSAVSHGINCLSVLGVWNWRGTNDKGGLMALGAWDHIALNDREIFLCFDSDVMVKPSVRAALRRFTGFLEYRHAIVRLVILPDEGDGKTGLDDYLAAGGTVEDLEQDGRVILPDEINHFVEGGPKAKPPPYVPPARKTLAETLTIFNQWLHLDDPAPVLITAATIAANKAPGDPLWLLQVGPPSSGKTESVQSAAVLPYVYSVGTLTEASLLSGVSTKDYDAGASGGLLRETGEFGVLLLKDFTSVLAMNSDARQQTLAALREIYDGSWDRLVGAGGGKSLHWHGKLGLIGGVTPAIDSHALVMGALGERFILLRLPDVDADAMGASALAQTDLGPMRAQMREAMGGLIEHADIAKVTRTLTEDEKTKLIALAKYTATARTPVVRDGYTREVTVLPQPEGTGRLVKQYRALLGGLEAIGCAEAGAWLILHRVARDSVPALRAKIIDKLILGPTDPEPYAGPEEILTGNIAKAVGLSAKNVRNHLEDLTLLNMRLSRVS